MFTKTLKALAVTAILAGTLLSAQQAHAGKFNSGPWFAIGGCYTSIGSAHNQQDDVGGYVVNTSNYDNFRPGYYCVVRGPFAKWKARKARNKFRNYGVHDSYIKRGYLKG